MPSVEKGIVLAGGAGTRLYPLTMVASKQLQAVYDKPMIYYPIATLMLAGIRDILIISTPDDTPRFKALLGDGGRLGVKFSYAVQEKPKGIAQAILIGESFIRDKSVCLILGDNIFYGRMGLAEIARNFQSGAAIFGYPVDDPQRYGVICCDANGSVVDIEEKPAHPKSNYAVPGLYIYDKNVVDLTKGLRPSSRGELEITDLNKAYLALGQLHVHRLGRGIAWLDTGTHESLLEASQFIHTIEKRQGTKIACLEEIAFQKEFISADQLKSLIAETPRSGYQRYLTTVLKGGV